LVGWLIFASGVVMLIATLWSNRQIRSDLSRLEAELGSIRITDQNKVHVVAIAEPDVPTEIALQL
jgi:hypothetical protein